ncbi:MAG: hypothetical protein JW801_18050 [Bacteroidales bacterium]|nr:hypothetical protein [Bacteroidales bacterium]
MLAGYHYEGKILSVTKDKVTIRRNDNTTATIGNPEIWKIVYGNGTEVILNESKEELESRIGKIDSQEALEEMINNGEDKEAEVACYFLISKGYQYESREKNLSDFLARFPNSKYRRELASMTRFKKEFKESSEIAFKCKSPYTPEVVDRKANFNLEFTDPLGVPRTLGINVILKFIRTYGKGAKLKSGSEWKNEYEIRFILDDSSEPVVINDQYTPVENQGDGPHRIFLDNVAVGDLNLNGPIEIGTHIRQDDGEYLITIDLLVDLLRWQK